MKKDLKYWLIFAGLSLFFILVLTYLNLKYLWPYLIPDDCFYHTHKPSALIGILFNFPASENGHSVPSITNFALTIVFGLLLAHSFLRLFYGRSLTTKRSS